MSEHRASTKAEAVRLHEAGWSPRQIWRLFQRRGIDVSETTIWMWTRPKYAARHNASNVERSRRRRAATYNYRYPNLKRGEEWREGRMRALRETGMSYSSIAKAMSFDWPGHPVTEDQVRYVCRPVSEREAQAA